MSARARTCLRGQPWPLGATPMSWQGQTGVNLAVASPGATEVEWCLFDADGRTERERVSLPACTDGVWHGFLPGVQAGQLYGLRAGGPWDPAAGLRFNSARLLIDPQARELVGDTGRLSLECGSVVDAQGREHPDARDNASQVPKARVLDLAAEYAAGAALAPGPRIAPERTVLYEAHVKGLTHLHPDVAPAEQGRYAGLASDPMLAHYRALGITTLCLLPVQQHVSEIALLARGLVNYWGYNTLAWFAPHPGYSRAGTGSAARAEFRAMVDRLHRHGFEVVIDVVYNHTAESDTLGPTLSWRGLDNAGTYALDAEGRYLNFTGCGNAVNAAEPRTLRWIMDSLRWWVQAFGVDGFRFDLAPTLGRDPGRQHRFEPDAALFAAMEQDPVLGPVRRIAESWDLGPGGYQVGAFRPGWQEWNDRFRDTVRAYWLGHACTRGGMARRMTGSSDLFDRGGRSPLASINLITAHDGFTLADLTAYRERHNEANGEHNRDGHSHNLSANAGVEGPSEDAQVLRLRSAWQRALLACLLLSQGTPQLLAGDEMGHTQQGNNNAYCQDNPITWLDWHRADTGLSALVGQLTRLRGRYPALRHAQWLQGGTGTDADVIWMRPDGLGLSPQDWDDPGERSFYWVISVGEGACAATERVLVLLHPAQASLGFQLPVGEWQLALHTGPDGGEAAARHAGALDVAGPAVCVLIQPIAPSQTAQEVS